jgi:hypothetical protein
MGKTLIGKKFWNLEAIVFHVCFYSGVTSLYTHTGGGKQAAVGDETKGLKTN